MDSNLVNHLTTDAKPAPRQSQLINEKETCGKGSTPRRNFHSKGDKNKNITIINGYGIHIGDRNVYNIGSVSTSGKMAKTDEICKLLENKDNVTKDHLFFLKSYIGENWKHVARYLGYKDGQIYQFNEDHKSYGISEVIYQLLLDWIQNNPETATIGVLTTALWENNEQEAVLLMSNKN